MFILEQAITKAYWAPRYRRIRRLYAKGHWQHVGMGVIRLRDPAYYNFMFYAMMTPGDDPRPMGWMELWQKEGWKGWDESQVWLFPQFRGRGLSKLLYKAVIDIDKKILYSGESHTKYTKHLWESFIKKGTYGIHAHDILNLKKAADVVWDREYEELFCSLPLYEDERTGRKRKRDIRLVAYSKEST